MACRVIEDFCKAADEIKAYGFDYTDFIAFFWAAGGIYESGASIRPNIPTGFQYISNNAGQSGAKEPRWPKVVGETVRDGSILWTTAEIGNESLSGIISTSVWEADDSDIEFDSELIVSDAGSQSTACFISGGAEGNVYMITNTVTLDDGSVEESKVRLTISE